MRLTIRLPIVAMMAGVFIYKFRKGWIALWITMLLQLPFSVVFPEVYFHNVSMPGIASVGAWVFTLVATGLFGLAMYPFVFFIVHGKPRQRLLAGGLTLVGALVSLLLFYTPVAERYNLDLNVDVYGKIVDLDGTPSKTAAVHLNYCTRYKTNPVYTDRNGIFRVRAACPQQLVVTRVVKHVGDKPCLTQTESSLSLLGGVMKFVSREQHRREPDALFWGDHDEDNPYTVACIWEPPRNRKEVRSYFRDLVADGRVYTAVIKSRKRIPYLTLYQDGRSGLLSLQLTKQQPEGGGPERGSILLRAIEGGIQPTDDRVINMAPLEGYADEAEIDLGDMQSGVVRRFYFHTYQRQGYGMIEIDYRPDAGAYAINTHLILSWNGERVLAKAIEENRE